MLNIEHIHIPYLEPDLKLTIMNERNIILFERYDGVRFVLERSLFKYKDKIDIFSSHWKNEIMDRIENENVDLLITELSKVNPDGFELTCFARKVTPELKQNWIKQAKLECEKNKVQLRKVRQDAHTRLQKDRLNEKWTGDVVHKIAKEIQNLLDKYVKENDSILQQKLKEIEKT